MKESAFDETFDIPVQIDGGDTGYMISRRQYTKEQAVEVINNYHETSWTVEDLQEGWVIFRFNSYFESPCWIVTFSSEKPAPNAQPIWYITF